MQNLPIVQNLPKWFLVMLAGAIFLTGAIFLGGCGSGSSTTSGSSGASTASGTAAGTPSTPAAATTPPAATTPSSSTGASSASIKQQVAGCKAVLNLATLTAGEKAKVAGICKKAESGDLAAAHAAARELCVEVINASPIASGATKERALAACKSGG